VPAELSAKLDDAELFHEVLQHRWFLSENGSREVPIEEAAESYVDTVLRHRPDEQALLDPRLMGVGSVEDVAD